MKPRHVTWCGAKKNALMMWLRAGNDDLVILQQIDAMRAQIKSHGRNGGPMDELKSLAVGLPMRAWRIDRANEWQQHQCLRANVDPIFILRVTSADLDEREAGYALAWFE